ncbi:glycosyltransferase family 4 protein [Paraburkholderia sp. SIMBA_030]|uniref:glycosyltransferase family 4 protein n=1 Tax=Paraburkholderia sp. SIMBA_030 TaxID=3085773 RepID=UPI00397AD386
MNILLTIHHNLSRNAGAPGVTVKIAEALRARGHTVQVLSHDDVRGVGDIACSILFPWFVLAHVIAHPEYDVLDMSAGDGWVINLARRVLGWRRRQLSVTRSHGMEPVVHEMFLEACRSGNMAKSWKYSLYHGGLRLWECTKSFQWADVAMLLNDTECAFAVSKLNLGEGRVVQIDNGIDETFTSIARKALSDAGRQTAVPLNLAFIGRANYWKGISTLVTAATVLFERNHDITLTLFGTGEPVEQTLARFPESTRERITAVPAFDNAALPELLARCHVLTFPSIYEGFPLSPLEAMACGLVPVVSDIGGLRAYVRNGDNGVIVPPGDPAALSDAVQALLDDPARWAVLQRRARETALEYGWARVADRFELLYKSHLRRATRVVA